MFTLRLLGGASLESDGAPLSGRATQKRRLALLALLARAPGRALSRDKLIAQIWPESDTEQARHLLSVALYELRRTLGEDALRSRGDDVCLEAGLIASDVEEFEAALEAQDFARAAELYAGPFLDGFFLSDAPEFERWAAAERERLEHRFRGALESLAEARGAQGDARAALEAWRRLAALDPYNTRVAVRLMQALAASGDRVGALQHARIHETLVREEFGAEPDPEVAELAERLRVEPVRAELPAPPPAPPAPGVEPVPAPEPAADPGRTRRAARGRRVRARARWLAAPLAVVLLALVWVAREASGPPAAPAASVAVLPFSNRSPDGENEYFSDGLTEEITHALARVEGLQVAARTSSFAFKGKSMPVGDIARQLGVRHVLEGSVQRAGGRVRISAQLVNAETGYHLWSERFDREVDARDIFAVYDEIARAVAGALRVRLVGGDSVRLVRRATTDPEAHNHYLRGRHYWYQRTPEGFGQAIAAFRAATQRDSGYADAHAGLADVYGLLAAYDYGVLPPRQAMPLARAAAQRALRINPDLAEAHATLGNIHLNYDWDWQAAEREFQRALALNPGYAPAYHWYSLFLLARGRRDEARDAILIANDRAPYDLVMRTGLARHYYFTREFDRSIQEYRHALELDPEFVTAHLGMGLAHAQKGEHASAIRKYETAIDLLGGPRPVVLALLAHARARTGDTAGARQLLAALEQSAARGEYVAPEYLSLVHLGLGDRERALHWLERAFENRSSALAFARLEPLLDPLRGDPRFEQLLRRVGV